MTHFVRYTSMRGSLPILAALLVAVACGDDGTAPPTSVQPTIDGARGAEEWSDATSVQAFSGATFLYKNDSENLYLALEVEDPTFQDNDRFNIRFDNERDGAFEAGENELSVGGSNVFQDKHSTSSFWGVLDTRSDGEGAAGSTAGTNFFEIAHPLDSGDEDDFSLQSGDVAGYCIVYVDDGTGMVGLTFPSACNQAGDDLSGYAELTVE